MEELQDLRKNAISFNSIQDQRHEAEGRYGDSEAAFNSIQDQRQSKATHKSLYYYSFNSIQDQR